MPNQTLCQVRALKAPAKGQTTIWDKSSPLGVRVSQGGSKTFIIMTGSGKRETIGRFGVITLAQARDEARTRLAKTTLGIVEPLPTSAYDEAKKRYLAECEQKNRPGTVASYKRLLGHLAFGPTELKDISPPTIIQKLDQLSDRPVERHHTIVAGRVFFNWCVRRHYLDRSPMERIRPGKAGQSRERVLSDKELAIVFKAALNGETHYHRIVALLTLTGQRKGEIAKLEWDWINGQERTITLPSSVTKNKRTHTFPIGEIARRMIASVPRLHDTYLFPAARVRNPRQSGQRFRRKAATDSEARRPAPSTAGESPRTPSTKSWPMASHPGHCTIFAEPSAPAWRRSACRSPWWRSS